MKFTHQQIKEIIHTLSQEEDGFSKVMQLVLESLMYNERIIHNDSTLDLSNGFRERRYYYGGKMLTLSVPRSRYHQFYPILLSVLKNQEEEYKRLVALLYTRGLTGDEVGEVFEQLYGRHYSKCHISRLMQDTRMDVMSWLNRQLDSFYPVVYIDAVYIYTRRGDSVSKEAYYTILGVKSDSSREVLSVFNSPSESSTQWKELFYELKQRGVNRINLVVCDGLNGIENAVKEVFPKISVQLCTVHLKRGILSKVKSEDKPIIAHTLKDIFSTDNPNDSPVLGHARLVKFIDQWKGKYPSLKSYLSPRSHLYFTYLQYDIKIRSMIYTTNWIERLNRNYRRVTRMRGALPSAESALFLLGSAAMDRDEYRYPIHAFIESDLFQLKT